MRDFRNPHINPRVGILGGGQLALMLANAAVRMGLKPILFAESSQAPATQLYAGAVLGSVSDAKALNWFFSQVDLVIFENEFVDCEKLKVAAAPWKIDFFPGLPTIEILQDKLKQKETFKKLGIPSSDYFQLSLDKNLRQEFKTALNRMGACVLKWSRMGYDGKGVRVLRDSEESLSAAEEFCAQAQALGSAVYVERYVPFVRELAVIGVHSVTREFTCYPVVVSEQENGICSRVFGPAEAFGLSQEKEKLARSYAERVAKELNLMGCFAIEFFETQDGELLVNEIAPRVHNSGHYTQDASTTDQFENHWRAVLGYPLGVIDGSTGFAMLNFLGPDFLSSQGALAGAEKILPIPGHRSHLHWYGKSEVRARRKLGHINGTVEEMNEMTNLLDELEKVKVSWLSQLRGHHLNQDLDQHLDQHLEKKK